MSDQEKEHSTHEPDSLPALLAINDPLQTTDVKWIIENKTGNLEADLMLHLIASILVLVPDNPQQTALSYIHNCKYISVKVNFFQLPHRSRQGVRASETSHDGDVNLHGLIYHKDTKDTKNRYDLGPFPRSYVTHLAGPAKDLPVSILDGSIDVFGGMGRHISLFKNPFCIISKKNPVIAVSTFAFPTKQKSRPSP